MREFGEFDFLKLTMCDERNKMLEDWIVEQNAIAITAKLEMSPVNNINYERSKYYGFEINYCPGTIGDVIQFRHIYTGSVLDLSLIGNEMY